MTIQVLVAAMDQKDCSLIKKMNLQSDALIGNQCDKNEVEDYIYDGHHIKYLSFCERGVGLNRNNTLMRATADICMLADDDMVYVDDYPKIVEKAFDDNPEADVIIFNLIENPVKRFVTKKKFRVKFRNFMRFGAARIAFKTKSVTNEGIFFNLHFGGGTEHSNGEDTIFLCDCLKANLTVMALPIYIAKLTEERESSWFNGYTDKYFIDRGALFTKISKRFSRIVCLQFCVRHRKKFKHEKSWVEAYKLMVKGSK